MPILRRLALALLVLASACATAPADPAAEPVYFVMRHLHTPEGERDPDLTGEGRRQAALLADRLAPERPAAIHVSDYRRTRQTAAPLAARLGLAPIVYDPGDTPGLVARVRAGPKPVLIVGHSNTVPEIVERLGGVRPAEIPENRFGDIWRISGPPQLRTDSIRIP